MNLDFKKWLKSYLEVLAAITITSGVFSAIVLSFGGSIPPWFTPLQAQTLEKALTETQKQIVETLAKINSRLDKADELINRKDCDDYIGRLDRARAALQRNPLDMNAIDLRIAAEEKIRSIPGCIAPPQR